MCFRVVFLGFCGFLGVLISLGGWGLMVRCFWWAEVLGFVGLCNMYFVCFRVIFGCVFFGWFIAFEL